VDEPSDEDAPLAFRYGDAFDDEEVMPICGRDAARTQWCRYQRRERDERFENIIKNAPVHIE
jgi:hypothetical protein